MNNISEYIQEKLVINKNIKTTHVPIESVENETSYKNQTVWLCYSPINSKGKPSFYRVAFNTDEKIKGKEFHIAGPYINRGTNKMVCLMADFKKGINYDENTIVASRILGHGYMFVAVNKEDLEPFNHKPFLMEVKEFCENQNGKDQEIKLKEYLETHL